MTRSWRVPRLPATDPRRSPARNPTERPFRLSGKGECSLFRYGLLAVVLIALFNPPSVWAHAFLAKASPPVGSRLPAPPAELTLRFTESVEPVFCTVELLNAAGAPVSVPAPLTAGDGQALTVALPKLPPGTYTVVWHVTSVDTHKTEGRYQFTIGP
jgi:methionine-rich copper-binding protein CopC